MGLIQDPKFWSGLKSTSHAFVAKCRQVGSGKTRVNIATYLILNPILLVSLVLPFRADAGVFSFIAGIFSSEHVIAEEVDSNSQKVTLLQAVISPSQEATTTSDIVIVGGTSLSTEAIPSTLSDAKTINDDQISLYVVRKGDTLPAIAKMFGVTVNTIRWANDIKGSTIAVDDTLVILPVSGIQHKVRSGDTLQGIAKLHKGDLEEILQYNNLTLGTKLVVGDVVVVPDGEMTVVTPVSTKISTPKSKSNTTYSGYYARPAATYVKSQGIHGYNGVDLAGPYGTNIFASAEGEVIIAKTTGWNGGYGLYVVLKHPNGTQTLYAHLSSTLVHVGQRVSQSEIIGKMGSTGKSTGNHLHFEIRGAKNPF